MILDFGARCLRLNIPQTSHVPVDATCNHLADVALLNALETLKIRLLVPSLRARNNFEIHRSRQCSRFEETTNARRVNSDGFLAEDMLAHQCGFFEVNRAKAWWRCQDDDVAIGGAHLLVGFEAAEESISRHSLHALLSECVVGADRLLRKEIAQRDNFDRAARRLARGDRVEERARAASTAADDCELENRCARNMRKRAAGSEEYW